jgi:dephospho-CoA kinase
MVIFGVTGGSGSGKTTVSELLSRRGVHVIDTDAISRTIAGKASECLAELTEYFGEQILNADGTLNRQKLASIAFSDAEKTAALSSVTHKYIKAKVLEDIEKNSAELTAIDGAVIIGSCIEPLCEFIVSVIADEDVRVKRIISRDSITPEQARERIKAQPTEEFYKEHSRYIMYNNGDILDLEKQVGELCNIIKGE